MKNSDLINLQDTAKRSALPFLSEGMNLIYEMRWLVLLSIILVLTDLWFGISASKQKGIPIRRSRAGRRTLNKLMDYFLYIMTGAILGKAIGEPWGIDAIDVAAGVMILCCGFELDSIYCHICELHNIQKRISLWRILFKILTLRFKEIQDIFTDNDSENKNLTNQ